MTTSEAQAENGPRGVSAIKQYKNILLELFAKMGYDHEQQTPPVDTKFRKAMEDAFDLKNLSPTRRQAISHSFEVGYDYANLVVPYVPEETRLLIGRYVVLAVYTADDSSDEAGVAMLEQFVQKFIKNEAHGDAFVDDYDRLLRQDLSKHYGPFSTANIIKSCFQFLSITAVEHQYANGFPVTSDSFPDWLRLKTGDGETYALYLFPDALFPEQKLLGHFLPAIPDLAEWFDLTNDMLSYYKERVVGSEENGYIVNRAAMLGVTEMESLEVCAKQVGVLYDRITAVLSSNKDLLAAWKCAVNGYILFHIKQPRYRLNDLF
ncbi:hypothetical protein E4U54_000865 [Claviceps lovelessii]|nr:hypothetical protein E4U54_000865 [Claviceps lovelessii]